MRKTWHNRSILLSLLFLFLFYPADGHTKTSEMPQKKVSAPPKKRDPLIKKEKYLAPDIKAILDRKSFTVAIYNANVPPFFMRNENGELIGLDVSIGKGIAEELGVKISLVEAKSFDDAVQLVYEGKADAGISKLSVTLGRAEKVRYTGKYVTLAKALLVNRLLLKKIAPDESVTLEYAFSRPGAEIAVIANSSYVGFARRIFPHAKVVEYTHWSAIVKDVLEGKILAAFRDEWEVSKIINDIPEAPLKARAIRIKGEEDPIEIIVPWESGQLARFIEEYIKIENINYDVAKLSEIYKNYKETHKFAPINQIELE